MTSIDHLTLVDLVSRQVLVVAPDQPIESAVRAMAARRVSSLVVVDGQQRPLGIVTERDIIRLMHQCVPVDGPISAVMSAPLLTVSLDLDFRAAYLLLSQHGLRHLVVVDDAGALVGIVSESDFRQHLGQDVFARIQDLRAIMDSQVQCFAPDDSLALVLERMISAGLDHVVVAEQQRGLGILTERDIPRLLARHVDPAQVTLAEVMSAPLRAVPVQTPVADVAAQMTETHTRHMAVVATDGRIVGVISQHRLLERLGVLLMEETRLHLETRLQLLLETTGVGIWEYDHVADCFTRSPVLCAMLGDTERQRAGTLQAWLENIHPADRATVRTCLDAALCEENPLFESEYRTRRVDGSWIWVVNRGRVVQRDAQGRAQRSAGIALDITERKQSEQRLRDSEARFRRFMEQVPLPLCHVSSEGRLLFVNERFIQVFGYTLADVPTLDDWWPRAYPDEQYRRWVIMTWEHAVQRAAAEGNDIQPIEYQVLCKNGERRIVEISGIILEDAFLATFIDVTERRRDQALLAFGNSTLERVARAAPLSETLDYIARGIEAQHPDLLCSILLLDVEGQRLRHGAAPSLPLAYCRAIDGAAIGKAVGSCGTAAYTGEPVFVSDIASDALWADYRDVALAHGLRACWSMPIRSSTNVVLGTFAVYHRTVRQATLPEQRSIIQATALTGIAIERARAEAALCTARQHLSELMAHSPVLLYTLAVEGDRLRATYVSDNITRLTGFSVAEALKPSWWQTQLHPEDRPRLLERQTDRRLWQVDGNDEFRIRHRDGHYLWVRDERRCVHDAAGQPGEIIGAWIDITATKAAEARLNEQIDELRRWHALTLGREMRVLELKREVNALLAEQGQPPRYPSATDGSGCAE